MLAFPALQAGPFFAATANCGVILCVIFLCGKATRNCHSSVLRL
jgi:hypothetical protein